ncbi:MAG: tetratricopeptide repeat protein [Thermodesulfobacterium sp.]|nr:tetratricopeptide repeat protein [Thermodesulfobacterium sp.]
MVRSLILLFSLLLYACAPTYYETSSDYRTHTNYAVAYYNRGNAYLNKGEYDLAIKDLTKAIELNPNYAAAYNNRGNGLFV